LTLVADVARPLIDADASITATAYRVVMCRKTGSKKDRKTFISAAESVRRSTHG
jgi:hypothetical protein